VVLCDFVTSGSKNMSITTSADAVMAAKSPSELALGAIDHSTSKFREERFLS
jgi:hypothetical protein